MSSHAFVTLDVFTDTRFGGNPLAVFPSASAIPEDLLLPITREFNFSETTFCYPPAHAGSAARVRIFTPGGEVPFAGHPTVGTAIALVLGGDAPSAREGTTRLVLEEGVGPIAVTVTTADGVSPSAQFATARLTEEGPDAPPRGVLASVLSLEENDFADAPFTPQALSCGIPFLLVPLATVDAVSRARVRLDGWEQALRASWSPEVFVFARDPGAGATHFRARMFAPRLNVPEDPATGSACACLAGYLAQRSAQQDGTLAWTVQQGVEMGRPSRISIEADRTGGTLRAIRVGGSAVLVSEGSLHIA